MSEVNVERLKLWTQALKSGQYNQTTSRLGVIQDGEASYCCLGIACEVAIANGLDIDRNVNLFGVEGVDEGDGSIVYDNEPSVLPKAVQDWFGFRETNPMIHLPEDERNMSLAECNDALNMSFEQIAKVVEDNYGV